MESPCLGGKYTCQGKQEENVEEHHHQKGYVTVRYPLQIKTSEIVQLCLPKVRALVVGGWRQCQRREYLGHNPLHQICQGLNSYMTYLHRDYYQGTYTNTLAKIKWGLLFHSKLIICAKIRIGVPHHHSSHLTATDQNTSGLSKPLSKVSFSFRRHIHFTFTRFSFSSHSRRLIYLQK